MVLKPADAKKKLDEIIGYNLGNIQIEIDKWLVAMGMAKEYEEGMMYPIPEKLLSCPFESANNFKFSKSTQHRLADSLVAIYREAGWNVTKEETKVDDKEGIYLHFKRK